MPKLALVKVGVQPECATFVVPASDWPAFSELDPPRPDAYVVQPVFVLLDDDGTVSEVPHPPIRIPADEWVTYSSTRFPAEVEAWQARLDAEYDGHALAKAK